MKEKSNKKIKIKKLITAISVFALVPVLTVCGCYTERSAFNWVKAKIDRYYYPPLPEDRVYEGSVKEYVGKYLDQYSEFYTKEECDAVMAVSSGNMVGLGISYEFVPQGVYPGGKSGVHLIMVLGNSPAWNAGLREGEFILSGAYNGTTVEFTTDQSFAYFLASIGEDKPFTLTTDRGVYQVSKQPYSASYCHMSTNTCEWSLTYEGDNLSVVEEEGGKECLPDGAAYLRLDQFYGNAAYEMGALIEKFNAQNCTSLILDLRRNGGGYVDVMSDISTIYTGQLQNPYETTGFAEYKDGTKEYFRSDASFSSAQQLPAGVKVSVLADNGTASASEALIGVLIDNGVIDYGDVYISDFTEEYLTYSGTTDKDCRTYGKGIMQTTYRHAIYGYAIKLTTAKIFWPAGKTCIHDTGLGQDMGCKTVSAGWNVTYDDEQLALAVQQIYKTTS